MSDLSSLENGGLSGISASSETQSPRCIFITEEVPVTIPVPGFSIGPSILYRTEVGVSVHDATPTQEGELIMYCPPPYQFAVPYCSVLNAEGYYRWVPTLIYRKLIQSISR